MQVTGEFKRMNLIPIKKAVLDPRKGLLLRTYYVNPQKFLEKVIQQKLKKSQIYIVKLSKDIQNALKTKNILSLKERFENEDAWKTVLNRNIEIKSQPLTSPINAIQQFGVSILNFITTLDNSHINKAKRQVKEIQTLYKTTITEKISKLKKVKTRVKIKEKITTSHDTLLDVIKYDSSKIVRKIELTKVKDPKVAGIKISKVINMLNPVTSKLIKIFDVVMNIKQFTDKYDIGKNIVFLPHHITKEPEFFKSFLVNMIIDCEQKLYEGSENVNPEILIYYYNLLLFLDKDTFNSLLLNFNRMDIKNFVKEKSSFVDMYTKYKSTPFLLSLLLFYPNTKQIINYLFSDEVEQSVKRELFTYISARTDISPVLLQRLYRVVFKDVKVSNVIENWLSFLTNKKDKLDIYDVLYQISFASLINIPYFPFEIIENVEPIDSPFVLTPVTKISKISKLISVELIDFLKDNYVKEQITCYIPVNNIPSYQNNIAVKLLPLQIGLLDTSVYSSDDNVDFVKVKVNEYVKVGNCIVFTPLDISN